MLIIIISMVVIIFGIAAGVFLVLRSESLDTRKEASGTIEDFISQAAGETVNGYARMDNGMNVGSYDPISNKTYVVYSGGIRNGQSACSPYIVYYDHETKIWSQPVEIVKAPVFPDAHNYPQILIDDLGYLHVFHSSHANHRIIHAISKRPRDIFAGWSIKTVPNTEKGTYVAAYEAQNGNFYLFYRSTEGNGDLNPPLSNWYEPQYVAKSADRGNTWSTRMIIDPERRGDVWNTIYVKSYHYEEKEEGVHILFGLHKEHNDFTNKHYYIFYSFEDDLVYKAGGRKLGRRVTRSTFDRISNDCLVFDYDRAIPATDWGNIRVGMDVDNDGNPIIAYNRFGGGGHLDYNLEIARWKSGSGWSNEKISNMKRMKPYMVEFKNENDIDVYAVYDAKTFSRLNYSSGQWKNEKSFYKSNGEYISHINPIESNNPEIKGIFLDAVTYTSFKKPEPVGKIYSFGKRTRGAKNITGYIGSKTSCNEITGWASDSSFNVNISKVHIYDNGYYIGNVKANEYWDKTVKNHGFTLFRNLTSQKHSISVLAEGPAGINFQKLNNSPIEIDCRNKTRITGYIDRKNTTCKGIRGWASDANFNLTVNQIKIYDRGVALGTIAANKYFNSTVGNHGFILNKTLSSSQHKIQVFGVDTQIGKEIELSNSPWILHCK